MQNFNELHISAEVMRAITELGYTAPTPIQTETLPLLLGADTDFLGLAATGTGKTAAFGIPLLERIDRDTRGVQALILCPTRELAMQVAGQIDLLGKYIGIKSLAVYGGTGYGDQIFGLKNGVNIVVGTPGRVVDHIEKGTLRLDNLKTLILDEADEMISMGFQEDLEAVLKAAPKDQANIWLFSATMGSDVKHVADAYLTDPKKVQVNRTEMLPDTVEQIFYKTHEYDKPELLCKVIDMAENFYGIVFCQTKALVADVNIFLKGKGYSVDCLHGDLDQTARDRVMKSFRERKISVLIATDVACRGLDVKDITHVVNYSIPRELDNYVHRIGRTGRSGKTGIAVSFVTFSHRELVGKLERMTKSKMKEGVAPTSKDIAMKRIEKVRVAFEEKGAQGRATSAVSPEWKASLESMEKEEIIGRFLNLMMPDLFAREDKPQGSKVMQDSRPASTSVRPEKTQGAYRSGTSRDRSGPAPRGKSFSADRPRFNPAGPGAPRRFDSDNKPRFAAKKPFGKPFSARQESEGRTPPWERKSSSPQARSAGFAGPASSAPKSRWKNNFSEGPRARPNQASSFDDTAAAIARDSKLGVGGEAKLKKKPYGHWKSKKDKPAAT